ncbi:MAG: alpha/beta fold hydrolase [Actinobacteria bacterium]|nr:alpha/beta fold hydrolase [Actinomycetota bacterium]
MTSLQRLLPVSFTVPSRAFAVWTEDRVRIEGTRLDGAADAGAPAVVLAHGLMGWHRRPRFARFAEELAARFPVYAFDFRGHGGSGGVCDYGGREIFDVDAVARKARADGHARMVTVGTSMGGIAVLRHAALVGGVDAVVSISSLATWDWHEGAAPGALRAMRARTSTDVGRGALRAWGVRLPDEWHPPESPLEVIGRASPIPVVIVHGRNDRLFGLDHAERLYEAAGEPKRLLIGDRFGHGLDGFTPAFAERLSNVIQEVVPA